MRHVYLFLFVAMIGLGCSSETPESLSVCAEKHYAEKAYSKAIAGYEKLLKVAGESPITYSNLALSAYQAQDYSYAIKMAEKALALGADAATADLCHELLGMIAEAEKDDARAIKYYGMAQNAFDNALKVRVYSRLAKLYMAHQNCDAALALLMTAREINPKDAVTLYNLGVLCRHKEIGLYQAALDSFRLAERILPPNSSKMKATKDQVHRLESHLTQIKQLPQIVGNNAVCEEALRQMRAAQKKKNYKTAEKYAREAMNVAPSSFEAALALGRLCHQNKHIDEALKAYDKAIALRPNDTAARYEAARLAYDSKKYKAAADYLRPALIADSKNAAQADLMGRILYAQNRKVNAKRWFERYLRLAPNASEKYREWVKQLPEV